MTFPLRFGIGTRNRRPFPELVRQWQYIENLGLDSAWVVDHLMASDNESTPYFEAWTLISALGAITNRIRFGVMVTGNTYRNPALLAKEAVTVDHASNGRLDLGIGAGWMEREHRAYSYHFPPVGERISMLEEAVRIIQNLMTAERTTFNGRFYRLEDAPFEPKPLQSPRIPIVIGAFKPRMLRLAARYADTWNTRSEPGEAARQVVALQRAAEAIGRDPATIRLSLFSWHSPFASVDQFRTLVEAYLPLGFTDLIFPMPPEENWPVLERCAYEVIPQLRRAARE